MDSTGESCLQRAVAWVSDTPMGSGGSAHRGGKRSGFVDHGHHAAFRMPSFLRAGGYDESFTHNEDAELDCRQRALGSRIYLDADIRLGYHPRGTWRGLCRQYFGYGRGRARTVRRHRGSMRLRQFAVPAHWAISALALALAPWLPLLLLWPALYALALAAVSLQVSATRRSPCGLLAGPAAAAMHGAWAAGFFWSLLSVREAKWQPTMVPRSWHDAAVR
jgi:succinoglycan biosynthesis protein ExoA